MNSEIIRKYGQKSIFVVESIDSVCPLSLSCEHTDSINTFHDKNASHTTENLHWS
jgi:hypothetical protein